MSAKRKPRSWRQRVYDWQQKLPLTREGKFWLLFALAMFVVGLWRSINLINLLACLLLMTLFYNWWLARRQLRNLKGQRILEETLFAQTSNPLTLEVINSGPQAVGHFWIQEQEHNFYLTGLPAKQLIRQATQMSFSRRGRKVVEPLLARTGFPLGLADCRIILQPGEEIIVLPRLGLLSGGVLRRILQQFSPTVGQARTVPRRQPTAQTEFHGLRSYQPGDSLRWIHWRTSARCGHLMVREFEETPSDNLILLVEPWVPPGTEETSPTLELLLSLAATICWEWCRKKGDRLILGIAGKDPIVQGGVTGRELALRLLEQLALEPGSSDPNFSMFLDRLDGHELPPGPVLLLSTRACESVEQIEQTLHRPVATVDVSRQEHMDFFEYQSAAPPKVLPVESSPVN